MRPALFALLVMAALPLAGRASAQAADPALCMAENTTSDQRLAACSAVIADNRATPQELARIYAERAWAYEDKGQHERAMSDVNEALRIDPISAKAFRIRGELYRRAGNLNLALDDYNQAIRLDPTVARAYDGRGNTFNNRREFDRAIEDYNEAIRLDPHYAMTYSNRGAAYYFRGEYAARHSRLRRGDPPRPEQCTRLLQSRRRLQEARPERSRDRGRERGHPARSERARIFRQSRTVVQSQRRLRPRHRGFQRGDPHPAPRPTSSPTAATPISSRRTTTAPSRTTTRRSSSIRNSCSPTTTAPPPSRPRATSSAPSPTSSRSSVSNPTIRWRATTSPGRDASATGSLWSTPARARRSTAPPRGKRSKRRSARTQELARFDRDIDAAYQAALGRLDPKKAALLRREQNEFHLDAQPPVRPSRLSAEIGAGESARAIARHRADTLTPRPEAPMIRSIASARFHARPAARRRPRPAGERPAGVPVRRRHAEPDALIAACTARLGAGDGAAPSRSRP